MEPKQEQEVDKELFKALKLEIKLYMYVEQDPSKRKIPKLSIENSQIKEDSEEEEKPKGKKKKRKTKKAKKEESKKIKFTIEPYIEEIDDFEIKDLKKENPSLEEKAYTWTMIKGHLFIFKNAKLTKAIESQMFSDLITVKEINFNNKYIIFYNPKCKPVAATVLVLDLEEPFNHRNLYLSAKQTEILDKRAAHYKDKNFMVSDQSDHIIVFRCGLNFLFLNFDKNIRKLKLYAGKGPKRWGNCLSSFDSTGKIFLNSYDYNLYMSKYDSLGNFLHTKINFRKKIAKYTSLVKNFNIAWTTSFYYDDFCKLLIIPYVNRGTYYGWGRNNGEQTEKGIFGVMRYLRDKISLKTFYFRTIKRFYNEYDTVIIKRKVMDILGDLEKKAGKVKSFYSRKDNGLYLVYNKKNYKILKATDSRFRIRNEDGGLSNFYV